MKADIRTIKSAHRVLEILEYFDNLHSTATVMDLSRSLSYPQSSTSELLRCLTRLGYLRYDRQHRTYSPTTRVALLGAWVEPTLFRGGAVLGLLDNVARDTEQTIILSTAINHSVQHLHVIQGPSEDLAVTHAGATVSLLHSAQGKVLLASYGEAAAKTVLHRLNAEEADPDRRLRSIDLLPVLDQVRACGWIVAEDDPAPGQSVLSVLLPVTCRSERLAISLVAATETMRAMSGDYLRIISDHIAGVPSDYLMATAPAYPAAVVRMDTFRVRAAHG